VTRLHVKPAGGALLCGKLVSILRDVYESHACGTSGCRTKWAGPKLAHSHDVRRYFDLVAHERIHRAQIKVECAAR